MSGIIGMFYLDNRQVNSTDLSCMMDSIAHRGPDQSGIWYNGNVGLGHCMLWTTPESLYERLPRARNDGRVAITADARIDNRDELITFFGLSSQSNRSSSATLNTVLTDSELILHAYEYWGENCCEHLIGDFAFVIWDQKNRSMFCARDHMGVKPFYYFYSKDLFVFSSEIKALFTQPEVPRKLNEIRIGDYLESIFDDRENTFFEGIRRLPAAHTLKISANQSDSKPQQYWFLDPTREITLKSDDEYANAFRDLFMEAVRCRLRNAFPIGSLLSGGLDSSSIVCMAQRILTTDSKSKNFYEPLYTFSAIFDNLPQCDERSFINTVLAQGNYKPFYVYADQITPLTNIYRVFWYTDEPIIGPNMFIHWALASTAHRAGVRVLLDGIDGDTTVSHGIFFLKELARTGRWQEMASQIKGLSNNFNIPPYTLLLKYMIEPIISEIMPQSTNSICKIRQRLNRKNEKRIIHPEFARRINFQKRDNVSCNQMARNEREHHYRRLTWGIHQQALELGDHIAAAHSLEFRYPFFDKRLIEFCLALPPELKIWKGFTRMIMRRAMDGILPPAIQWREGKSNLSPNFHHGLSVLERERVEDIFSRDLPAIEQYANITVIRQLYERYISKGINPDSQTVWNVVNLILWMKYMKPIN